MRRLVAALACRVGGSRLYGKPLQRLAPDGGPTVLDCLVSLIRTVPTIDDLVLGVAEGVENSAFVDLANESGLDYIIGDERDVLSRLIECGKHAGATDIFRVTTESPFFYFESVESAFARHVEDGNDLTTTEGLPDGANFEIFRMEALQRSHDHGDARHRSEYCGLYIREHRGEFKVDVLPIPDAVRRPELRLTVDNPEDLVLCRAVFEQFQDQAPRVPIEEVIQYLDTRDDLKQLVAPFVEDIQFWT